MAEPSSRVESTGDSIAHALRQDILAGRLTAGERLIEEAIAKKYGVSRVPVREALTRLQSEGFVTIVRYRGAAVSETLVQDGRELLQIRRGLEVLAAQLAATNRGGEAAGELAALAEDVDRHGDRHDDEHGPSFHELVAAASGNRQLVEMLAGINRRVQWGLGNNPEASTSDHRALAQAIVNGSVVQAGYLMDEHLRRDERYFADEFEHD
ncbi:GntR family transcriptional regulator [Mycolicibacterium sp. P1-18]|uniref:GntR family transcriptional regulator n=1 Tax=Mycolicibacterium sp. P1-18 TaxID=2024615 RepID=UPI0011F3FC61|nr:GntR family transcriptional regulator [Mycolicibacterium sp. P1-18]KAA0096757.1 GntR family transcriptional regulator [Mycolicibacterium sp. P1-18]